MIIYVIEKLNRGPLDQYPFFVQEYNIIGYMTNQAEAEEFCRKGGIGKQTLLLPLPLPNYKYFHVKPLVVMPEEFKKELKNETKGK